MSRTNIRNTTANTAAAKINRIIRAISISSTVLFLLVCLFSSLWFVVSKQLYYDSK